MAIDTAISLTNAPPAHRLACHERGTWSRAPQSNEATLLVRKLRGLRAMVAVLECDSVARAARMLHLSQSAVARSISDIEAELGFPLFHRSGRGLIPNAAGQRLGVRATRALAELANGYREAFAATASQADGGARAASRFAAVVAPQQLTSFIAVAELGSGPLAATRLQCSQPTIQRNLDQLEDLIGIKLFRRTPRGTRLTDEAVALLGPVKRALAELAIAEDELAPFGGRQQGTVIVAALPLSSGFLLPKAIDSLLHKSPYLSVTVVDGTYEALVRQLRQADVDMIVGALRANDVPPDIRQEALFEDHLSVVARADHPCLTSGKTPTLAELAGYGWVSPLPCTPARGVFERVFHAEGLALPHTQVHASSSPVVRGLLSSSDRLALLSPVQITSELRTGELAVVPVTLQHARRSIGVATRRDGLLSPAAEQLLDELRALAPTMQHPT
ncbi:LysR family transcriptional regulator [Pandoraea sputorum]